jgi:Ricin-type beta-trefoil lectin domain
VLNEQEPNRIKALSVDSGLSLPFAVGEDGWTVNGLHGDNASNAFNSMDFIYRNGEIGNVTAMGSGNLSYDDRWCTGGIVIQYDGSSFKTLYTHIRYGTKAPEGRIAQGQVIGQTGIPGKYSRTVINPNGDACGVGNGTRHVHIDLYTSGSPPDTSPYSLDGYVIGGWEFSQSGGAYTGCVTNVSNQGIPVAIGSRRCMGYGEAVSIYNASGGTPPPVCPSADPRCPPPPAFQTRLLRTDSLALNFRIWTFRAYSWLYPSADGDPDQNFRMYAPGSLGGNSGWMLKRLDNDDCLNANAPSNGSSVYGFACSGGDGDQQWELHYYTSIGKWFMIRRGTNQCLNAYAPGTESRVNMFSCDTNDEDQRWSLTSYPGPIWNLSTATIGSSAIVGQTPGNQSFTITNDGMVAGGHLVGGPASYQLSQTGNWFVIPATGADLSRGVDRPNASNSINVSFGACTAVGTVNGTITVSGSGGAPKTINVSRTCNEAPKPIWTVNPTSLQFNARVGATPSNQTFTITNSGTAAGTLSMGSSNDALVTSAGYSTSMAAGTSTTASVIVSACTSVGITTGQLTVGGSGANNTTVAITRVCDAALPSAPSAPSPSSITMSSNGRIFIAWPEVSGATQYDFQATFNGAAISVTGQAPNRGGTNGSAVATFLSAPDAADKQGKQVCFSMRATNTGGSSAFSSFACTTYKYYAGGLTVQSSSDVPRLTLK